MAYAFVMEVGGGGLENIAVAAFQFFQDTGLVKYTRTSVTGECTEKNSIFAIVLVKRNAFGEILLEKCLGVSHCELDYISFFYYHFANNFAKSV